MTVTRLFHKKNDVMQKASVTYFLVCRGLSNDGVGVARGTAFQEIRPGAGFKNGNFVKESFGRATTVERLGRGHFWRRFFSCGHPGTLPRVISAVPLLP